MADEVPVEVALEQTQGFRWAAVPPTRGQGAGDVQATERVHRDAAPAAEPPLGALGNFTGVFQGRGLNTIFRPQNFAKSPTDLPVPGVGIDDNILELNLTEETLSFSAPLGSIPNRGMVNKDIFLNGVPYLQTINDISDPSQPVGIHFEPGVWLRVPTTDAPKENASLVRMASIPHGTTITAQGRSATDPGAPTFKKIDITPFAVGDPTARIRFDSQTASKPKTFRLPQDLTHFITAGTITQAILDNPNLVLKNRIAKQTITETTAIDIATKPKSPLFGGGTDNIAFLLGDATGGSPNADAVEMTATFWIETVSEKITVPPCTPTAPATVVGSSAAGAPVPTFRVTPSHDITSNTSLTVTWTQIQYSQTVLLNFNRLSWPHVSVATLVPKDPIPVNMP
jgi:hypothetical protein